MGAKRQRAGALRNEVLWHAEAIGQRLRELHGADDIPGWEHGSSKMLPGDGSAVADDLTMVVAEILQSWLDAGSEREVTEEEIGPIMRDHCRGWSHAATKDREED